MLQFKKIGWGTRALAFLLVTLLIGVPAAAQEHDTAHHKQNKLIEGVINAISRDTVQVDRMSILRRNDEKYRAFSGLVIRTIDVARVPFGVNFSDTTREFKNTLTNIANTLHHVTRVKVIRNNLFFHVNDTLNPYLFADNERYLRELPYMRDADFDVKRIEGTDSVDVTVVEKDLFNIGGNINSLGLNVTDLEIRDDNFSGTGNAAILYASYDDRRKKNLSFGGEYIRRNIGGSFLNQQVGYRSYYNSIRAPRQENYFYYNLTKPLLHRFMKFTYELSAALNFTSNRYDGDSLYQADFHYGFYQFEGWLGYNMNGKNFSPADETRRLRLLSGIRVISKTFFRRPLIYEKQYNWQFADLSGVLGSFTFYRQNFFKTQYVYGFGVNEDIPEGLLFTTTLGYTIQQDISRPFIGLNFQQYGFTRKSDYFDYTLRFEGYLGQHHVQDVNMLASVNFFSRLKHLGNRWKQRSFITVSASRQINNKLGEPLLINSKFAMPEYGYDPVGGDARITTKFESVFFSPWSLAAFRFAPLAAYNLTAFSPAGEQLKLYSSIGAGIRTRNESLIFGTVDLRANYFPSKNYHGSKLGIDISVNLSFKFRSQFLKKPDFIEIN